MPRRRRPEHEGQAFAAASSQLQPAQMLGPGLRQPAQQGAEAGALQDLFDGPQTVGRLVGLDQQDLAQIDIELGQGRRKHPMRRRQQDDAFTRLREPAEDRRQQAEFTAALLRPQ